VVRKKLGKLLSAGLDISPLAQKTGHSRNIIRKYVNSESKPQESKCYRGIYMLYKKEPEK
jgi:hypothetical protein